MNKNLDDFINYLEYERNYSNNTVIAYKNNIIQLIDYLDTKRITNIKDVDYDTIRTYLSYLYDNKYKAKSISRMISSMRSFFKYLMMNKVINSNPMLLISNPKVEKKLPKYLTINEVESYKKYNEINACKDPYEKFYKNNDTGNNCCLGNDKVNCSCLIV